jgi:outer membrane protein OmpA-like peptidoglycan-associated protein
MSIIPPMPIPSRLVLPILIGTLAAGPLAAQREYRIGASVGGAYQSYGNSTELGGTLGVTGRVGYWVWRNKMSVEIEGGFAAPKSSNGSTVNVTTLGGAALYNLPLGVYSSLYVKAGYGMVGYGSCPDSVAPSTICGTSNALLGGLGARIALSPTMMLRTEAIITNSNSSPSFSNLSIAAGMSFMLGSRPLNDTDQDGVYDRYDRCPATAAGAIVNGRGCPSDTDQDGVADGIDRCPQSPAGSKVDAVGCPQDADRDVVLDGIDRCPDTPVGATVDRNGCPSDTDKDGVLDGLDRCASTPSGATVDRLGCPGDADNDRVLDGIDRCPDTPPGTIVNSFGCPPTLDSDRDNVPDVADLCPGTPPGARVDQWGCPVPAVDTTRRTPAVDTTRPAAPDTTRKPAVDSTPAPAGPAVRGRWTVPGTAFDFRSAKLKPEVYPQLDSIAAVLRSSPTLKVEIGGNAHDRLPPAENQKLSTDRAQAVRLYLIGKGVRDSQLRIRGHGANDLLTQDTSDEARTRNRRIEITPIPTP